MSELEHKQIVNELGGLTDHELLLLLYQNVKSIDNSMDSFKIKLDNQETKIDAVGSLAHKELETYKDSALLSAEVKAKEIALELNQRFEKVSLRFVPLESFKTFLLGAISTNSILTVILTGLVIYIITNK